MTQFSDVTREMLTAGALALELREFGKETPLGRRWRIQSICKSWQFDAYRVLSAAGLADRDAVRDAEYQDYLRWKAEPPRTITIRKPPRYPAN